MCRQDHMPIYLFCASRHAKAWDQLIKDLSNSVLVGHLPNSLPSQSSCDANGTSDGRHTGPIPHTFQNYSHSADSIGLVGVKP